MKRISTSILMSLIYAGAAFAADTSTQSSGLLANIFIGFFALIVLGQLIPGLLLLVSMFKGLWETKINAPTNG